MPELTDMLRQAALTEEEAYARDLLLHVTDARLADLKRQWKIDRPAESLRLVGSTTLQRCVEACKEAGVRLDRAGVSAFKTAQGLDDRPPHQAVIGPQTAEAMAGVLLRPAGGGQTDHVRGALRERIQANRPVYERAGRIVGVPWRLLAAIHYREHECRPTSPGPGGPFQMDPPLTDNALRSILGRYKLPFRRVEADFQTAAVVAGHHLQTKVGFRLQEDTSAPALLKDALWGYNGRAYGSADNSPYVANDPPRRQLRIRGSVIRGGRRVRVDVLDSRPGAWIVYQELLWKFP